MNTTRNNGFTLIELIIVMVILGIMAAVAVPRYLDSISNAEESAENAVINSIRAGLKQYANNKLYSEGRAIWPNNPFDALSEKPAGYDASDNGNESGVGQLDGIADSDGEWTFDFNSSMELLKSKVHSPSLSAIPSNWPTPDSFPLSDAS